MNNSLNVSASVLKQIFLLKLGSSVPLDAIYLFVISPLGVIGTLLMLISFVIFLQKDFRNNAFFQYFQVYTLSSLIQAMAMIGMFLKAPRYLFDLSISESARIYCCRILSSYVVALFFFFGDAIFILLNMERIAQFSPRLKSFMKIHPYLACCILLVICELINLPTFFVYEMAIDEDIKNALSSYKGVLGFKGLCPKTQFGLSPLGQAFNIFGYVVKGLVVLLVDFAINITSYYFLRDFLKKKLQTQHHTLVSIATVRTAEDIQRERAEKAKVNQTRMVIYLTTCTVVLHVIQFVCNLIILLPNESVTTLLIIQVTLMMMVAVKQILNFGFYFFFNSKFRKAFKAMPFAACTTRITSQSTAKRVVQS